MPKEPANFPGRGNRGLAIAKGAGLLFFGLGHRRSKLGGAHGFRRKLEPQFHAQVPHPLRHKLPALLTPGQVTAPTIGVLFSILICQSRLKGATVEVHLDDIRGGERLLWQRGEEQFLDDPRTRDANWTLLVADGMGRHHHAARFAFGPHRHLGAVVEATHDRAFRALLELIGGQVQTCLDERVIEYRVLFATGDKGEAGQIGEYGPSAILPVEPEQGTRLWDLVRREVARDRRKSLAQFRSVVSVASVAKTAELCGIKTDMSRVIELTSTHNSRRPPNVVIRRRLVTQ